MMGKTKSRPVAFQSLKIGVQGTALFLGPAFSLLSPALHFLLCFIYSIRYPFHSWLGQMGEVCCVTWILNQLPCMFQAQIPML